MRQRSQSTPQIVGGVVVAVLAAFFAPGAVSAQDFSREDVERMPGRVGWATDFERMHDKGWYMRVSAGSGFSRSSVLPTDPRGQQDSGVRIGSNVALGGYIRRGTAWHVGALSWIVGPVVSAGPTIGVTHYFDARGGTSVGLSAGVVRLFDPAPDLMGRAQRAATVDLSLGFGKWTGATGQLGIEVFAGATHLDLDADGVLHTDWRLGARAFWSLH